MRNVGFTIETKPDYCQQKHVDMMLDYGITRVEIGVQSLTERVYNIVNRGHDLQQVISSFQIAKDAGYKIVAHMMPGLPTMSPKEDIADFKKLFEMDEFKPDMPQIPHFWSIYNFINCYLSLNSHNSHPFWYDLFGFTQNVNHFFS